MWNVRRFLYTVAFLLGGCVALPCIAFSQDEGEPENKQDQQNARNNGWNEENFDQWVFSNCGNLTEAKKRIDSRLELSIEEVHRICSLTTEQLQKLRLAGRGDTKRFLDRVEAVRKHFQKIKNDQAQFQQIWQEIGPLQLEFQAGLFKQNSMYHKSIERTLHEEQLKKWKQAEEQRRLFRRRAALEMALLSFEEKIPLRDTQRQELLKLVLELPEIAPQAAAVPVQFGMMLPDVTQSLTKIPEEKLKAIFDDYQWGAAKKLIQQMTVQAEAMQKAIHDQEEQAEKAEKKEEGEEKEKKAE